MHNIISGKFLLFGMFLILSSFNIFAAQVKPTAHTVTGTEDVDYVFVKADFPFTGGTGIFKSVIIRSLPGTGTLYYDANSNGVVDAGEAVIVGFECIEANLPNLKFKPVANASGSPYSTFLFGIKDSADAVSSAVNDEILTINISSVNDAPTASNGLFSVNEDVNFVFASANFNFTDIDGDSFFSLRISSIETAGSLYLDANSNGINDAEDVVLNQVILFADISKLKFISALNQNGSPYTQFSFQVSDGTVFSVVYALVINVNVINDSPVAASKTVQTVQSINYNFSVSDFSYSDVEGNAFNLLRIVTIPAKGNLWVDLDASGTINEAELALLNNSTVTLANIPKLTFKPILGENGSPYTTFTFDVNDGTTYSSSVYTITVDVLPVNQEPVFTAGANQSIAEDSPAQTVNTWAVGISPGLVSESAQIITFHLSNDNNSLFAVQPSCNSSGVLTYTPVANAFGTANVDVYVTDDGGTANGGDDTSPVQSFTIQITAVNDAPIINNLTFSINENSANGTFVATVIASDPDPDILNYSITAGNTNAAFAINAAIGNITVNNSAELNYEITVSYSLTVNIFDGTVNSSATVTVNINDVNDIPPVLNASVFSSDENIANGTNVGTLTFSEPEGNPLSFSITAGNTGSAFTVTSPAGEIVVANSSALDFETNPVFNLTVQLSDGAFAVSNSVTVNLNNVNDAPRFTSTPVTFAVAGNLYSYSVSTVDDDGNPIAIAATLKPAWLSGFVDNGDGTATLSGTPALGDAGNHSVTVNASDFGLSKNQNFIITVAASVINVPADFASIQNAVNSASGGDIILVADGIYNEKIDFSGKNISVIGNTANPSNVIIDGGASGSVVTFNSGENSDAILNGFTIRNGSGTLVNNYAHGFSSPLGIYGGGIYCSGASPTLENLIITQNTVNISNYIGGAGAGVYFGNASNAVIKNCEISDNISTQYRGGGICIDNSDITLTDTEIHDNSGGNYGGGISVWNSDITMQDVSIYNNDVAGNNSSGGGIFILNSNQNCNNVAVFNNTASITGIGVYSYASPIVGTYSGTDSIFFIH
jgi:hypothetical protein